MRIEMSASLGPSEIADSFAYDESADDVARLLTGLARNLACLADDDLPRLRSIANSHKALVSARSIVASLEAHVGKGCEIVTLTSDDTIWNGKSLLMQGPVSRGRVLDDAPTGVGYRVETVRGKLIQAGTITEHGPVAHQVADRA